MQPFSLIAEHFITPKKKLYTCWQSNPMPSPPQNADPARLALAGLARGLLSTQPAPSARAEVQVLPALESRRLAFTPQRAGRGSSELSPGIQPATPSEGSYCVLKDSCSLRHSEVAMSPD